MTGHQNVYFAWKISIQMQSIHLTDFIVVTTFIISLVTHPFLKIIHQPAIFILFLSYPLLLQLNFIIIQLILIIILI